MELTKYKLGDIADISVGFPFESERFNEDGDGVRLVRGMNVSERMLRFGDESRWWSDITENLEPYFLKENDIVIGMDGSKVGKNFALIKQTDLPLLLVQRVACIRAKKGFDQNYIWHYVSSPRFIEYVNTIKTGSAIPHISGKQIGEFPIFVPPLPEQKKIASVLSALDDKIALNKKMNQKLEAMAKRLYDYWFVQYDFPDKNGHPYKTTGGPMTYNPTLKREIPEGWEVKKVSDYADLITKGTTPSTLGFDFQDVGINFVKVECIENGQIRQENLMHISEEAHDAMKRSQLHGNDILVTIAGRLGSAAIVSEHILPANTNQAVALIRMKKEYGHLVNYIYRVISSSSMQKRLQGSNAQSIQKNLTLPILGDIEFVQDSNCEIIKRFNEITKPIFLRQQENIQEISRLTALRDKLLPLLMNGQVEA